MKSKPKIHLKRRLGNEFQRENLYFSIFLHPIYISDRIVADVKT